MAGRKPKPEGKRRSTRTTFLTTEAERARIDAAAALAEVDLSEWIRVLLIAECDRLEIPEPKPAEPTAKPKKR